MKKLSGIKIYPFAFLLMITLINCTEKTDLREYGLRGSVKSVSEKDYAAELKFGKWEAKEKTIYSSFFKYYFSVSGDATETEYFNSENKLVFKSIRTNTSNESDEVWISYDSLGKQLWKEDKVVDSDSSIKRILLSNDGAKVAEIITYFRDGRKIKSIQKDLNSKEESTLLWNYDNDGNETHFKFYISDSLESNIIWKKYEIIDFDSKKNWIKRLVYQNKEENPSSIEIREIEYY